MISARIKRQLETLDWDFSEHLQGTSKAIHWYPGTFPSEIPTTLIQALSVKGELVFDPYGGVGTTALEALRQGRKAWLVEANPVGCLIAYTACGLILLKSQEESIPSILFELLRTKITACINSSEVPDRIATDEHIPKISDRFLTQTVEPSPARFLRAQNREINWKSLENWIARETITDIRKLTDTLNSKSLGSFGQLLALTMISAVLRPASSQTQSWGHIADNVWPKKFEKKDFYKLCLNWLSRTEGIIKKTVIDNHPGKSQSGIVFWLSSHCWQKGKKPRVSPSVPASVLITSPPYAGAIDYTLSQRLSLYLLGYTEEEVKKLCGLEIGARRKRFLATSKNDWANDLVEALEQQASYMSEDGSFAFVLPHKDSGREIGPSNIEEFLDSKNCPKIMEIERSIIQGRARQSWTSIKKEIIQIYSY
ncbi:hypothetical protein J2X56_004068 [Herbaspirillum sp. 1173]|uniref:DNA methyltransferase n=1 Tax=Herbaspirillum sp. 1173 TaxID=2817734 RepID=UPI0028566E43|nr:DNA methyltransferase [Herbaspirillum sp. 1173]MDR6742040.1 hypothetical protein [Herbaspirillum sp. 1173]